MDDVRVAVTLTSAHAGQDAALAAIFATDDPRSVVPPFTLVPGDARTMRIVAAQPRDAIHAISAAGRPMLVPLVAVSIRYSASGTFRHFTQAFAIGQVRGEAAKLAPFWLDQPPRMSTEVASRPQIPSISD